MSGFSVFLTLALLLASSTASSFATTSTLLHVQKTPRVTHTSKLINRIRGGSADEENNSYAPMQVGTPAPTEVSAVSPSNMEAGASSTTELAATPTSNLGPNAPPPGFLRKTFPSFPWHRLPDMLTYIRCLAIPIMMVLFYRPNKHVATGWLFAIASFTDWLDGYLARRWDITSAFGAFLDPVADKLMVSTSLILLAGRYGREVAIPTAIILAREIAVSALREWMAQRQMRDVVKVGFQGKLKTAMTMLSLTLLLFVPASKEGALAKLYAPSLLMLYVCALVTVTSGSVYFRAAAPMLLEKE